MSTVIVNLFFLTVDLSDGFEFLNFSSHTVLDIGNRISQQKSTKWRLRTGLIKSLVYLCLKF